MANTLRRYYDIYFLPLTDIPFKDVPRNQKMIIKQSISYARWIITYNFNIAFINAGIALSELGYTCKQVAESVNKLSELIKKIES